VNFKQKENTAKLFLDLAKILATVFVIGGFVPNSPISGSRIIVSLGISAIMYVVAMFLLKGE